MTDRNNPYVQATLEGLAVPWTTSVIGDNTTKINLKLRTRTTTKMILSGNSSALHVLASCDEFFLLLLWEEAGWWWWGVAWWEGGGGMVEQS